jgi:hypothetical protein
MLALLTLAQYLLYPSNDDIASEHFDETRYELLSHISTQTTAYLLS